MKIEQSSTEVSTTGDIKKISGGISTKKTGKLVDFLSNSLYSDPIGSMIRELTSNCYDAYIALFKEKGIESQEAVIVKYSEEEGQGFISFIDFGIGLSPEKIEQVYLQILESDKEDEDNSIGGFGIGGKSFLAYTDSMQLITRYDGVEYYYIVGKDENGEFGAYLVEDKPTEEKNGTEIKICIGDAPYFGKPDDYNLFKSKIQEQLFYFDNVYVDGFELDNEWNLFEGETFKFRTGWKCPYDELHIVLGKVIYPINWEVLGIKSVKIPVGIKFEIGELQVTISRESIRYTEKAKELIKERVKRTIEEIIALYNKQADTVDTLEEYYSRINADKKFVKFTNLEGIEYQLSLPMRGEYDSSKSKWNYIDELEGLEQFKWKPIAHLPIKLPKDPFFMFSFDGVIYETFDRKDARIEFPTRINNSFEAVKAWGKSVYRVKNERSRVIDRYIFWKEQQNSNKPALVSLNKFKFHEFIKLLDIGEKTKVVERNEYNEKRTKNKTILPPSTAKIILEFKKIMIKEIVSRTSSYDQQKPSPAYLSYLQLQKIAKRKPKLEGVISIYNLLTNSSDTLDLSKLNNFTGFIIYGTREQAKEVRNIKDLLCNHPRRYSTNIKVHKFFTTGARNCELLQGNPYYLSVEQFMSGHNRLFKNAVTAYYIEKQLKKCTPTYLKHYIKDYNKSLADRIKKLEEFVNKNRQSFYNYNEEFCDSLVLIGKENGLLWNHLIKEADEIREWFSGLDHLMWIESTGWRSVELQKDILTILKSRGKRIGNEHYLIKEQKVEIPIVEPEQLELELPDEVEACEVGEERIEYTPHISATEDEITLD